MDHGQAAGTGGQEAELTTGAGGQEAELTGTDHWLVLMFATLVTGTVSLSRATTAAVTDQLLANLPLKRFTRFGQ